MNKRKWLRGFGERGGAGGRGAERSKKAEPSYLKAIKRRHCGE